MIEVMSFWEHREKYPELYTTEEENIKFNYNNNKGKTMTNDKLSTQMAEALALANAERAETTLLATAPEGTGEESTTFVQEENTEDRATVQV
jgi:hypothetical protein